MHFLVAEQSTDLCSDSYSYLTAAAIARYDLRKDLHRFLLSKTKTDRPQDVIVNPL